MTCWTHGKRCSSFSLRKTFDDHHQFQVYHKKMQYFQEDLKNRYKLDCSIMFPQSQIIAKTMNNQSWKIPGIVCEMNSSTKKLQHSQTIERFFAEGPKEKKQKAISISKIFTELTDKQFEKIEAVFLGIMAQFVLIFNVNLGVLSQIKNLSEKCVSTIQEFNEQSGTQFISSEFNRDQFAKFFYSRINKKPGLTATLTHPDILILIIQKTHQQQQKYQVKVLNSEGILSSILCNFKPKKGFESMNKFLGRANYMESTNVICFNQTHLKEIKEELISFLLSKFKEVYYMAVQGEQKIEPFLQKRIKIKLQNREAVIKYNQSAVFLSTHQLSGHAESLLLEFYDKWSQKDKFIMNQSKNKPIKRSDFNLNRKCISLYGLYYNQIVENAEENLDQTTFQQIFLQRIFNQMLNAKKEAEQIHKKQSNSSKRKLGHHPERIINPLTKKRISKMCCVCQRKTSSRCELCTSVYDRDVVICPDEFKYYHDNPSKYMPNGVKKGAQQNKIKKIKQLSSKKAQKKEQNIAHDPNDVNFMISLMQNQIARALQLQQSPFFYPLPPLFPIRYNQVIKQEELPESNSEWANQQ